MSAWIVSRAQIDALVLAGIQLRVPFDAGTPTGRPPTLTELATAGTALWTENHCSVNHHADEAVPLPGYTPTLPEVLLDPVAVVKLVDCYTYQSDGHPAWAASPAADYCARLRTAALAGLPLEPHERTGGVPFPIGWDARPWSFHDIMQIALQAASDRPHLTY